MNHEPSEEVSPEQVRCVLELRGIPVVDDDLAALPVLVTAMRRQANGLRDVLASLDGSHPAEGKQA
jgi:hypothetical protein